ncbi:hypothetical protein HUJ05_005390 [Dendroctonus ponderosae]|nr:hypothetical protein HUJ05_005390 [Dendroctonus ponderosae]
MRCSTVSWVVFINLMLFGMGSYFYMVWQYRQSPPKQSFPNISTYDNQIFLYNRGFLPNKKPTLLWRTKHASPSNVTYVKRSMPRFPSLHSHQAQFDGKFYTCLKNESAEECRKKTSQFKKKILVQLSNSVMEESNVLKQGNSNNSYNVHYAGPREDFNDKPPKQVLCELLSTKLETLRRADIASTEPLRASMPKRHFFENRIFNSCVVVASSGALKGSNMGKFIGEYLPNYHESKFGFWLFFLRLFCNNPSLSKGKSVLLQWNSKQF